MLRQFFMVLEVSTAPPLVVGAWYETDDLLSNGGGIAAFTKCPLIS